MYASLQRIIDLVNELAPPHIAEEGDRVGLQIGNPEKEVKNVLVALDLGREVLSEARQRGADLIITHHPLFYRPLYSLDLRRCYDRLVADLLKEDIAVFSAHTNLDAAPRGVNYVLARCFNLQDTEVLQVRGHLPVEKLVVFVPAEHVEQVRTAVVEAGAGWLGNYSHCTFQVSGTGTFKPLPGSNPFIGETGRVEVVSEARLETVLPRSLREKVLRALFQAHPYEEVAYDIYPLENEGIPYGFGCLGFLEQPMTLKELASWGREVLGTRSIKVTGRPERAVKKVAVCGGSGSRLIGEAAARGADALITGDIKYHDAQEAEMLEVAVIDAGHDATERPVVPHLAAWLQDKLAGCGYRNGVFTSEASTSPWWHVEG